MSEIPHKAFNAYIEGGNESYPDQIWFTPEDDSSKAYIRLDLHEQALSSPTPNVESSPSAVERAAREEIAGLLGKHLGERLPFHNWDEAADDIMRLPAVQALSPTADKRVKELEAALAKAEDRRVAVEAAVMRVGASQPGVFQRHLFAALRGASQSTKGDGE